MTELEAKEIYDKLNEIEIRLVRIEDKLEAKTEKIINLEKQIFGNGKDGILKRIQDLEKFEARIIGIAIAGTFIANYVFKILSK